MNREYFSFLQENLSINPISEFAFLFDKEIKFSNNSTKEKSDNIDISLQDEDLMDFMNNKKESAFTNDNVGDIDGIFMNPSTPMEEAFEKNTLKHIEFNEFENEENKDFKHSECNEFENEENKDFSKKKRGRKCLNDKDRNNIIHTNSDKDNVIYKLKVYIMKNVYYIIPELYFKYKKIKVKLNRIDGDILKNGKKSFNLEFLNLAIKDILNLTKSKRHKNNKKRENKDIIKEIEEIEIIKTILNMKFSEFIDQIFMLSSDDFKQKFEFENAFLFSEIQLSDEQRNTMKDLFKEGLLKHFEKIKGRNRTKKSNSLNSF